MTDIHRITDPDARWAAVLDRDAAADGHFVYAVQSTRIYCRPSCPSRRPRRERVTFFDAPAAAAGAGFRACRRCAPDAAGTAPRTRTAAAVERARALLDAAAAAGGDRVSLGALAGATGVSAAHLQRAFTRIVGVSPARYAAARRAARWKAALRREGSVSRATYNAGYAAASRAYAVADAHLGMTPAAYRRGGAGVRLWWTTFDTPLGRALAAATARGVCAVLLAGVGEDDTALEAALAAEYPAAERHLAGDAADDDGEVVAALALLDATLAAVRARAGGRSEASLATGDVLPVDAAGTAWQRQVWDALRAIPAGETRTYAELAAALGRPTAARAVARACATNRVALVVPCHRVVPAGAAARRFAAAAVSGYRWGPALKARLLTIERAVARDDARGGAAEVDRPQR
ncbi:bifunctional transcriptional activator/DNA repair enzyme protein Ada [Gemmatimonadetes bacterium T265]|nr:bifunctional transcriptional activator/DNA repair enzyme protein Ada [Gemmatimonadetes bacterium T265]